MIGPMYGKSGRKYSDFWIFLLDFRIIPPFYLQIFGGGMIGVMLGV